MIRRETKQKEAILNVLHRTDSHPTADWIYDEVRNAFALLLNGCGTSEEEVKEEKATEVKDMLDKTDLKGKFEIKADLFDIVIHNKF